MPRSVATDALNDDIATDINSNDIWGMKGTVHTGSAIAFVDGYRVKREIKKGTLVRRFDLVDVKFPDTQNEKVNIQNFMKYGLTYILAVIN